MVKSPANIRDSFTNEQGKNVQSWIKLIQENPSLEQRLIRSGLSQPVNLETISWDDSMILFLCSINVDEEGKPIGIGESLKREKFGRFPFDDGSLQIILIEFLRPNVRSKIPMMSLIVLYIY